MWCKGRHVAESSSSGLDGGAHVQHVWEMVAAAWEYTALGDLRLILAQDCSTQIHGMPQALSEVRPRSSSLQLIQPSCTQLAAYQKQN